MNKIVIKFTLIIFLSISILSCGSDKKENKTEKNTPAVSVEKTKAELKKEEQAYYEKAIQEVLKSSSEYAYYKSELGVNIFIKGSEIICFLDVKNETDAIYSDNFFANVYKTGGKESLKFEFMDFEKDDVKIDGVDYMFAAFNFKDVDLTSSIQVGQYSKEQKKITWKVLIPKGRFHK